MNRHVFPFFVKGVIHVVFQVSCYVEFYTQQYFRDISSAYFLPMHYDYGL